MANDHTTPVCGSAKGINRRTLITTAPLAGFAAAVAAIPVAAEAETPIMRLFEEWKDRRREEMAVYDLYPPGEDVEEFNVLTDRVKEVEERMFAEPATGLADMAIKLCVSNGFGDWDMNYHQKLWAEARALTGIGGEA